MLNLSPLYGLTACTRLDCNRLGQKCFQETNALAYFASSSVTKKKGFIMLTIGSCDDLLAKDATVSDDLQAGEAEALAKLDRIHIHIFFIYSHI